MKNNLSFEEALKRLEEITAALEAGNKPLEESIKLYEEGAELASFCDKALKTAEQKISVLTMKEESSED